MFTGIVEEVGRAVSLQAGVLTIEAEAVLEGTRVGDSLLVNGACLTVTGLLPQGFTADVVPETLRKTNLGALLPGDRVNLERAVAAGGRLGGHIVQGHVEATGELVAFTPDGQEGLLASYRVAEALLPYIVPKGFIAVDGVSLTVVDCTGSLCSVALIPFTREHTNLGSRRPGDRVNLETDIIARYVERLLDRGKET